MESYSALECQNAKQNVPIPQSILAFMQWIVNKQNTNIV